MIDVATAIEFVRPASNGRTAPLLFVAQTAGGEFVDVFCKFSSGCEEGEFHLAREAVAACLASDLGLPVNKPYLVELTDEFLSTIADDAVRARLSASNSVAFGSTSAPNQFSTWARGNRVSEELRPLAAATFFFDGIVQNPDRRPGNSNCLVRGNEIRLIDHELTFTHRKVLFWREPWKVGGLRHLETDDNHIFREHIKNKIINYDDIRNAWSGLSDAQLSAYKAAIPAAWAVAHAHVDDAIDLVSGARDHIDDCIVEIQRVLR